MALNELQVKKTLNLVVGILEKHKIEYRVFGSVIPAVLNGRLHRELGDIDLLVEEGKKEVFMDKLKKLGYKKKERGVWKWLDRANLFEYRHPKLLEISFFALKFGDQRSSMKVKWFGLEIDSRAIRKIKYNLGGVGFWGILVDTACTGALISKANPKRKRELEIFESQGLKPRLNEYVDVYLGPMKVNWILDLLNWSLNWLGRVRVMLGMSYDFWR
jgi:hypothetical protein